MPDTQQHHENNRKFYDRISEFYDAIADANERAARLAGVEALALKPGEKVLELGFGTGNEVLDLARIVGPTGQVAGIDISPGMLEVANKKIAAKKPDCKIDLRVADARQLPFADGSFDAVYSSFTLELFPAEDIPVVLQEVKRVLKAGGRFGDVSMSVVPPEKKASFLEKTYVWMHQHFPHIVDCRPIDVPALVQSAGLSIKLSNLREIWTMPVAVVVAQK